MSDRLTTIPIKTRYGIFHLSASAKGLRRLYFPQDSMKKFPQPNIHIRGKKNHNRILRKAKRMIQEYLKGRKASFAKLLIDYSEYTPFERRVLKALGRVPSGKLVTYKELAILAGSWAGRAFFHGQVSFMFRFIRPWSPRGKNVKIYLLS